VQEESKVGNDVIVDPSKCCYLDCIFANMLTSPPFNFWQGVCGKKRRFHYACNVSWLESKGTDTEFRKICYTCVCAQYSDV